MGPVVLRPLVTQGLPFSVRTALQLYLMDEESDKGLHLEILGEQGPSAADQAVHELWRSAVDAVRLGCGLLEQP